MKHGITQIIYKPNLGNTPASVNRETGVMYISLHHAKRMPFEHVLFMMLHEKAHVELQTTNEIEADERAFQEYAQLGYSLTESVKALTQVLNENNKEHAWRMYLALERAKKYDLLKNKNTKVLSYGNNNFVNR